MIQSNQNEVSTQFGNWVAKKLDNYELILVVILAIVLILKILTTIQVGVFIILILGTLSTLYFFNGFAVYTENENIGGLEYFIVKLASWGCSIATIGILFRLLSWPNNEIMLIIGSLTLIFSLIGVLVIKNKKPDLKLFSFRWIIRLLLIAILGLILRFSSTEDLIKTGLISKPKIIQVEHKN
jgi:hypothetical protein